jgi:hypothetical protein
VIRALVLLSAAVCLVPRVAPAQGLPFRTTIVDWDPDPNERQQRAYSSNATGRDILYCVESWRVKVLSDALETIVIAAVRRAEEGTAHHIRDVGDRCVGSDGKAQPMFHTHSDGNGQFSPTDLITLVARRAPFEGIQCGERHFVWNFAWQVLAIANSVERERFARGAGPP